MPPKEVVPSGSAGTATDQVESNTPWSYVRLPGLTDWIDVALTPLSRPSGGFADQQTAHSGSHLPFDKILSSEQKRYLLTLFDTHYAPWLNLPWESTHEDEFLDIVRCTIACRHMEPLTRSIVSPSLNKLSEAAMMRHVFDPSPSLSTILAFMILSLWSPLQGSSPIPAKVHDNRLIAAAAVNMCNSLRLDQAAVEVFNIASRKRSGEDISTTDMATVDALREKALIRLFEVTEHGLRLKMSKVDEAERYYEDIAEIVFRFDGLHRIFKPLPVISDRENFQFHIMVVYYYFCRLLFLTHTLHQAHGALIINQNSNYPPDLRKQGSNFVLTSARDAMLSAESLLTAVLAVPEKTMLATVPDSVFSMISSAAAYIVVMKIFMLQIRGVRYLPGFSDNLLSRIIDLLTQVSLSPDHEALKCAHMVASFLEAWEKKLGVDAPSMETTAAARTAPGDAVPASISNPLPSTVTAVESAGVSLSDFQQTQEIFQGFDGFEYLLQDYNTQAVFGQDLWQYFTENDPILPNHQ
ncbi:hypothetical protein HETIRDRAFT_102650 [Heterobasidion irregulare TC 32-1]|uniref:Transcription factor domain-containing protein n=1 Tax=Heterobasidion irregulare (strain TC 32-1) TaxID=747525 RepID=W4KFD2_HETIT|nr:uncharacterized protein HETIRDRAFT_102650 [Heterobasidion irregulare TC 32-1]ETW84020.1 hypothetical protein HETIRDRAFT_102650 [Heterobasidion irregulare TC 32-1]